MAKPTQIEAELTSLAITFLSICSIGLPIRHSASIEVPKQLGEYFPLTVIKKSLPAKQKGQ